MKKVFKYPLSRESGFTRINAMAKMTPVMVQMQNYVPQVWIELAEYDADPSISRMQTVEIAIFPTGVEMPDHWKYINSFQEGVYVWHCYYRSL